MSVAQAAHVNGTTNKKTNQAHDNHLVIDKDGCGPFSEARAILAPAVVQRGKLSRPARSGYRSAVAGSAGIMAGLVVPQQGDADS